MCQCVPSKGDILVLKTQNLSCPKWGTLVQDIYILTVALKTKQNKLIKSSKIDEIVCIFSNVIAPNSPNNHVLQLYYIFTEYTNLGKLETYRGLQSRANFKDHEEHKDKTDHVPQGLVQLCSACLQG